MRGNLNELTAGTNRLGTMIQVHVARLKIRKASGDTFATLVALDFHLHVLIYECGQNKNGNCLYHTDM